MDLPFILVELHIEDIIFLLLTSPLWHSEDKTILLLNFVSFELNNNYLKGWIGLSDSQK